MLTMNTVGETNRQSSMRQRSRIPLCWLMLIAFDVSLMALVYGQDPEPGPVVRPVQTIDTKISGPDDVAAGDARYEAIDVFVDSGNQPLAAWQLELMSGTEGVEIVGIEGGEHPAFAKPPYYDPRAMKNNRVILGAFNTGPGDGLPSGRSRVARVHVRLRGPGDRLWHTELTTSASADGTRIPAEIAIAKAGG